MFKLFKLSELGRTPSFAGWTQNERKDRAGLRCSEQESPEVRVVHIHAGVNGRVNGKDDNPPLDFDRRGCKKGLHPAVNQS